MGYIFDTNVLHELVRGVLDLPLEQKIETLVERLSQAYPGHVRTENEWVLNVAGGAMGQMRVLHASLTEYIIVFGSPIGTEGHTGRFMSDDFFYILEGEQWAYPPGSLDREVYRPGDMHHLARGVAKGYRFPERCYALEYARGIIPFMLPFGFADGLTSTLDLPTLAQTVRVYVRAAVAEILQGKL